MNSVNNKSNRDLGSFRCDDVFNTVRDFLSQRDRAALIVNRYIRALKDPKIEKETAEAKAAVERRQEEADVQMMRRCHV